MSMSNVGLGQSFQCEHGRPAALQSFARIVTAVVLAAPGLILAAATPLHLQDRAFMTYAIEQDLAQIAFGEMAMERPADPQVKRFAEKTVTYHRGSAERLRAAAA